MAESVAKRVKDYVGMVQSSQAFSPGIFQDLNVLVINACRAFNAKRINVAQGRSKEILLGRPRCGFDNRLLVSRLRTALSATMRHSPRTEPFFDTLVRYPVFPNGTHVSLLEQRSQKRG